MAGVEDVPTGCTDDTDYLGHLNAPGSADPGGAAERGRGLRPAERLDAGQTDANAPGYGYPAEATFQLN